MTPPRAGTFIYHTHLMELRQMESGLYGAMIVLPPGAAWDAAHDHVFILGTLYTKGVVLNGAKVAPELEFDADSVHRLRLINITTGAPAVRFQLVRPDSSLVTWTPLAKDAIDLPAVAAGECALASKGWPWARPTTCCSRRRLPASIGLRCAAPSASCSPSNPST